MFHNRWEMLEEAVPKMEEEEARPTGSCAGQSLSATAAAPAESQPEQRGSSVREAEPASEEEMVAVVVGGGGKGQQGEGGGKGWRLRCCFE